MNERNGMPSDEPLRPDAMYCGDARMLLPRIEPNSVALAVWSPPYCVGKRYEMGMTFDEWQDMLQTVIRLHTPILKPGGFLVVNVADILTFRDPSMPRIRADVVALKRHPVRREDILRLIAQHPGSSRSHIARMLGCSEQTVARRLRGNNARGGKSATQTRVKLVGGLVETWGLNAGLYLYDRRIWIKDAAWSNCKWLNASYRSVDEFEYLYIFWKPGVTRIDQNRLTDEEWRQWGMRAVWQFPSVRVNDIHEAMFPIELPYRVIRLLSDPGDTVLDCFAGVGTTAIAAIRAARRYIGIERDDRYVQIAIRRIQEEQSRLEQLPLLASPSCH